MRRSTRNENSNHCLPRIATTIDLQKSSDGWYLPVVTSRGLRQRSRGENDLRSDDTGRSRDKSLTTGVDLRERRSTTRSNLRSSTRRHQSIGARTLDWPPEVEQPSNDSCNRCAILGRRWSKNHWEERRNERNK